MSGHHTERHSTLIAHVCMYVPLRFGGSSWCGCTHTHAHPHGQQQQRMSQARPPACPESFEGCASLWVTTMGQHHGPTHTHKSSLSRCLPMHARTRLDLAAPGLSCDLPCAGSVVILPDGLPRISVDDGLGRMTWCVGIKKLGSDSWSPGNASSLYSKLCQHVSSVLFSVWRLVVLPKPGKVQ
jgi:hypothetical protein